MHKGSDASTKSHHNESQAMEQGPIRIYGTPTLATRWTTFKPARVDGAWSTGEPTSLNIPFQAVVSDAALIGEWEPVRGIECERIERREILSLEAILKFVDN